MSKFKMVQMIKVKSFIILYDCIITYVTNITKNEMWIYNAFEKYSFLMNSLNLDLLCYIYPVS